MSVQAQILRLLLELQKEYSLSYMLITHNIAVAEYLSDFMLVMYSGDVVEYGQTEEIMAKPRHPYTIALISSAPIANPWKRNLLQVDIRGEVPSAINPPSGCKFHPRCPYAESICSQERPKLREISQDDSLPATSSRKLRNRPFCDSGYARGLFCSPGNLSPQRVRVVYMIRFPSDKLLNRFKST